MIQMSYAQSACHFLLGATDMGGCKTPFRKHKELSVIIHKVAVLQR